MNRKMAGEYEPNVFMRYFIGKEKSQSIAEFYNKYRPPRWDHYNVEAMDKETCPRQIYWGAWVGLKFG